MADTPAAPSPIQSTVAPVETPKPAAPAAAPQAPDESTQLKARLAQVEGEATKKTREQIAERRKWAAEKQSFGEKLKQADEFARLMREKDVNPVAAAKRLWGDKWNEHLMTVQANGGAPTAESVALEIERVREDTRKQFEERDANAKRAQQEAAQQAEQGARTTLVGEATHFYKATVAEYPVFKKLGNEEQVAAILANQFSGPSFARYRSALASADADTRVTLMRGAADALEGMLLGIAEEAVSHEKYQPKFRERLTPPKQPGSLPLAVKSVAAPSAAGPSQQQPRRTLGNDLTGSTPSDAPRYRSDSQRLADAIARGEAAAKH